jgi:hypothetical protein
MQEEEGPVRMSGLVEDGPKGMELRTSSRPRGPACPLALKTSLVMTVTVLAAWRMPAYTGIHDLRTGSS